MSMTESEAIERILYMGVGRSGLENENSCIAKALKELQHYRAIGTVSEFQELKEKATAKRVNVQKWIYTKCDCGYEFSKHHGDGYYSIPYERQTNYCPNCGQKLVWSEGKE